MTSPTLILLAGGNSSRFAPLSNKNLFRLLGKPLLQFQLEKLVSHGFTKIVLVTNQSSVDQVKKIVEQVAGQIEIVIQSGTGQSGAIIDALTSASVGRSDVLVMNANDFFEDELFEALKHQLEELRKNQENLLTGIKVDKYFPGGYLVVKDGFVTEVIEKPGAGNEPSDVVRIVFDYFADANNLLSQLKSAVSEADDVYEVALTNMMQNQSRFKLLSYSGVWRTLKYPWHMLELMEYFLENIAEQSISANAQIASTAVVKGNVIIEDGVKIFDHATINGPAYIGKGTIIGNNALVRNSVVGENCVIGFGSEVARSYLADKVWLHMNYVGDSIVDSNVSFGSTAVTANLRLDEQEVSVQVKNDKISSNRSKLGAIIGKDVRIGVGTKLMPGVRIGSNCAVGAGLVVREDVADNSFIEAKTEIIIKPNRLDISLLER